MELDRDVLVSPPAEVPVIDGEVVLAIRTPANCGVGSKAIARAVGIARNSVRRYLHQSSEARGDKFVQRRGGSPTSGGSKRGRCMKGPRVRIFLDRRISGSGPKRTLPPKGTVGH